MLFFAYLIAATSKKRMLNNSLRFVSYFGLAMSNVLLALIIMLLSTVWFGDSLTGLFSKEYRGAPWDWDKLVDFISRAWLPIFILGWSATNFALQTVWALISDEYCKLYVTVAKARGLYGQRLLRRDPARHALEPIVNSLGFDHNRVFNELPIVAILLVLTRSCPLLLAALARSNDQQLAGAITFLLTASIVMLSLVTDIALAIIDPRVRRSVLRS
ncbi:MAG: ABC transporter permease subunit [Pseudomonadota bacterium]